jgi:hypothetical protein
VELAALPTALWSGPKSQTWRALTSALGISDTPAVGARIDVTSCDVPPLGGTVIEADSWRLALLLDRPAPGTAILAVEGVGDHVGVSIWSYLYGEAGAAAATRDAPRWEQWLAAHA